MNPKERHGRQITYPAVKYGLYQIVIRKAHERSRDKIDMLKEEGSYSFEDGVSILHAHNDHDWSRLSSNPSVVLWTVIARQEQYYSDETLRMAQPRK